LHLEYVEEHALLYSIILTGIGLLAVRSQLVCTKFICLTFNHLYSWVCIISVFALPMILNVDRRCPIFDFIFVVCIIVLFRI
jgi:hypothetical protein